METGGPRTKSPARKGPGNGRNHALEDYQMQMMLLERQNKKQIMIGRQAQGDAADAQKAQDEDSNSSSKGDSVTERREITQAPVPRISVDNPPAAQPSNNIADTHATLDKPREVEEQLRIEQNAQQQTQIPTQIQARLQARMQAQFRALHQARPQLAAHHRRLSEQIKIAPQLQPESHEKFTLPQNGISLPPMMTGSQNPQLSTSNDLPQSNNHECHLSPNSRTDGFNPNENPTDHASRCIELDHSQCHLTRNEIHDQEMQQRRQQQREKHIPEPDALSHKAPHTPAEGSSPTDHPTKPANNSQRPAPTIVRCSNFPEGTTVTQVFSFVTPIGDPTSSPCGIKVYPQDPTPSTASATLKYNSRKFAQQVVKRFDGRKVSDI